MLTKHCGNHLAICKPSHSALHLKLTQSCILITSQRNQRKNSHKIETEKKSTLKSKQAEESK